MTGPSPFVTVVSGLPRSGTSMMMRMLAAGGMELLTDGRRTADEDNPVGYFEYEPVKALPDDASWVQNAEGRAVKVISALLPALPATHRYRVVFMERDLREIQTSQRRMIARRGVPPDDTDLEAVFRKHLAMVRTWLDAQPGFQVLYVSYAATVEGPKEVADEVATFLGLRLDRDAMAASVDPSLYRNRA